MANIPSKVHTIIQRNAATTNINASSGAWSELLTAANNLYETNGMYFWSSTSSGVQLAIGEAGSEVVIFSIGGGNANAHFLPILIPKGVRISIRAIANVAISAGLFTYNLFH